MDPKIRVFVSGCYDILHAGHVQFFTEARALGDHLTVSFASADSLWQHKQRRSSLPDDHKRALLLALSMVVIASMIGAGGLGSTVLTGIQRLDVGLGFEGGLGVVILAIVLDRITQSFRRQNGQGTSFLQRAGSALGRLVGRDRGA